MASISSATTTTTTLKTQTFPSHTKPSIPSSNHLSFSNSSISPHKLTLTTKTCVCVKQRSEYISSALKSLEPSESVAVLKSTKPTILVSEKLGEAGLDHLRTFGDVECLYDLSADELCARIASFDALIVRSGTKVTRKVFEAAKGRLKVVGRAGVGIDNVDLQAATEHGCLVVNAPTANTIAAAEHGIALLAGMARNVAQADASMKAGGI